MTIGELARLFNDEFGIGAAVDVIQLEGWTRSMYFDETGLPWIIPSPNVPTLDSAIVYPGAVLFEGTKLSEGRGTTRPFELVGAPCRLRVRQSGFEESARWRRYYSVIDRGWKLSLTALKDYVERQKTNP